MFEPLLLDLKRDMWVRTFSWDSTKGYTSGFSHAYPEEYGPSPADVYAIFAPIVNQAVIRNNAANKQIYEQKASVTTLTSTGSYVVTITDWKALIYRPLKYLMATPLLLQVILLKVSVIAIFFATMPVAHELQPVV